MPFDSMGLSAQQFIAMLNGDLVQQQVFALKKLSDIVSYQWHEIADALPRIEEFIGNPDFPKKELAAYVASQVFYHLEESEDALRLALDAGELFDIREENSYVRTLLNKCLDQYMQVQQHNYSNKASPDNCIPRTHQFEQMEGIINRMFNYCFEESEYKQAIGIALEARRPDMVIKAIATAQDNELLTYSFKLAYRTIGHKDFRHHIL